MKHFVGNAAVAVCCLWGISDIAQAVTVFHVDTFQSGTTDNWSGFSPMNISTGGPTGAGDAYLQITASGGNGPGSRIATYNDQPEWTGDFGASDVLAITVDLRNPSSSPALEMRLVLFDPNFNQWTSTNTVQLPNDDAWHSYPFFVAESELTPVGGSTAYATLISDVSRVMLRHQTGPPADGGTSVVASLDVDNPRVVPTIDCQVFDDLVAAVASGMNDPAWDLNRDDVVDLSDVDTLRAIGGLVNLPSQNPYLPGDANLDGVVDGGDFNIWNAHKSTSTAAWCSGDFNADGVINDGDFSIWNAHKFTASGATVSVPEPAWGLFAAAITIVCVSRRRRS